MAEPIPSLLSVLAQVPDPRHARGRRYPWAALLLLLVVGLLSGANSQRALARWGHQAGRAARQRLGLSRRASPSQPTLHRVLAAVDVAQLEALLGAWLQRVRAAWRRSAARWLDGIAVDGKTLRGARRLGAADAHLLSACCQRLGLVLGELAVPDPTTERGAIAPLLERLVLSGETMTLDAGFTQYAVADQIVRHGGAYLMVVKANQPTLLADCIAATQTTYYEARGDRSAISRGAGAPPPHHLLREDRDDRSPRIVRAGDEPAPVDGPHARGRLRHASRGRG